MSVLDLRGVEQSCSRPSVAYLVEPARHGTAYGLLTMMQNAGLAAFNLLIGWSNDQAHASAQHPAGYGPGLWLCFSLGLASVLFAWRLRQREVNPAVHSGWNLDAATAPPVS